MLVQRILGFLHRWALAFFGSLYAFTLGLLSRQHRQLMLQVAMHFGYHYQRPVSKPLPSMSLAELFPQGLDLPLAFQTDPAATAPGLVIPAVENGGVGVLDLAVLAGLVRKYQPKTIFEIGTFRGVTTFNLALNAPGDARVFTLDLPREAMNVTALALDPSERQFVDKELGSSGVHFQGTQAGAKITQLFGDSAVFDFGPYQNAVDLVFIDGSHAYEYVLSDARQGLKLLRDGKGVLVFHDYLAWDGVTKALEELALSPDFKGLVHVAGTPVVLLVKD